MKKKILQFGNVELLRRNEKLHSDSCYILSSESVALNTYFETKADVVRAHIMFGRHLSPVMDIIDYLITPNGWLLVVSIKPEVDILTNIDLTQYDSKKMRLAIKQQDISTILSECIRYAISGTATRHNEYNERLGTLVSRNFSRFIFQHVEVALEVMEKMKKEEIKLCWQRGRYKPCLKAFDMAGELESGDVFLCTRNYAKQLLTGELAADCLFIIQISIDVLRKLINTTFKQHSTSKNPYNPPENPTFTSLKNQNT